MIAICSLMKFFALMLFALPSNSYYLSNNELVSKHYEFNRDLCCGSFNSNCESLGNNECDFHLNNKQCLWDFGDCLPCSPLCYFITNNSFFCESHCYPADFYFFNYNAEINELNFLAATTQTRALVLENIFNNGISGIEKKGNNNFTDFQNLGSIAGTLFIDNESGIAPNMTFEYNGNAILSNILATTVNITFTDKSTLDIRNMRIDNGNFSLNVSSLSDGCTISVIFSNKTVYLFINNCGEVNISIFEASNISLSLYSVNSVISMESLNISNAFYPNSPLLNLTSSTFSANAFRCDSITFESSLIHANYAILKMDNLTIINTSNNSSSAYLYELIQNSTVTVNNLTINKDSSFSFLSTKYSYFTLSNSNVDLASTSFSIKNSDVMFIVSDLSCSFSNFEYDFSYIELNQVNFSKCSPYANSFSLISVSFCNTFNCLNPEMNCLSGFFKSHSQCFPCNDSTYSLHQENGIQNDYCFKCSASMRCRMSQIYPMPTYWRHPDQTKYPLVFRDCPYPDACVNDYNSLGSQNKNQFDNSKNISNSWATICANGYEGNFCHACDNNFTKVSLNVCSGCPQTWINISIIISLLIMFIVLCYFLVTRTIATAFEPEELYSIGARIFVNYFQIIYLCFQYKIVWPSEIQKLTSFHSEGSSNESGSGNYFFSFKCLMRDFRSYTISDNELFYITVYFMILIPIILYIFSVVIILILKKCVKQGYHFENYKTVILIVPFLLVYPTVLTYALAPYGCFSLRDGAPLNFDEQVAEYDESYLILNRNIICNLEHYKKVAAPAIVGVLCWGLGVPLFILSRLYRHRKNLFGHEIKYKYGFLFNGYKHRCFYWEFVILVKKFFIVSLTVFFQSDFNLTMQSVLIIVVLVIFILLQIYFKPYVNDTLNLMELVANWTAFITVLLGIIYSNTSEQSYNLRYFIIVGIVLINFAFICYWFWFMGKEIISYIVKTLEFLRKKFYRIDPFDESHIKEKSISHVYMLEHERIYTPAKKKEVENERILAEINDLNHLFQAIVRVDVDSYRNNILPEPRTYIRRPTMAYPAARNLR